MKASRILICALFLYTENSHGMNISKEQTARIDEALKSVEHCRNFYRTSKFGPGAGCFDRAMPAILANITDEKRIALLKTDQAENLLGYGNYLEGFPLFDQRLIARGVQVGSWKGQDVKGKTVLIRCEMGLGDTFFFARFIQELKKLGATVIVLTQGPLKSIMSRCPYIDKTINGKDAIPAYDYDVYLMSTPQYLSSEGLKPCTLETIPNPGKYIFAKPELVKKWAEHPDFQTSDIKIGINWRSSKLSGAVTRYLERDFAAEDVAKLAEIPGVRLFVLQSDGHYLIRKSEYNKLKTAFDTGKKEIDARYSAKPSPEEKSRYDNEISKLQASTIGNLDEMDVIPDNAPKIYTFDKNFDKDNGAFEDTAAVMENLDLIISSDTSVPNLAGALYRPTWFLLPYESDWRWGDERTEKSAWHPTARLFWQQQQGDWKPVMKNVTAALQQMVDERKKNSSK